MCGDQRAVIIVPYVTTGVWEFLTNEETIKPKGSRHVFGPCYQIHGTFSTLKTVDRQHTVRAMACYLDWRFALRELRFRLESGRTSGTNKIFGV